MAFLRVHVNTREIGHGYGWRESKKNNHSNGQSTMVCEFYLKIDSELINLIYNIENNV